MNMNNNNHRAYAYHPHETEICHGGRLGCWVKQEGAVVRGLRWVRCVLELAAFGLVIFVLCALCAVA